MEGKAEAQEEGISHVQQSTFPTAASFVQLLISCICCPLKALEEEFTRKLQEQEVFFKMSGESECLNPTTQSRVSKFYPIPNLHNSGS